MQENSSLLHVRVIIQYVPFVNFFSCEIFPYAIIFLQQEQQPLQHQHKQQQISN